MYAIDFSSRALKALIKVPANTRKTIRQKIDAVARDPRAANSNCKPLVGRPGFRLRVGDWRVIYSIDDGRLIVHVIDIGPRGSIYE